MATVKMRGGWKSGNTVRWKGAPENWWARIPTALLIPEEGLSKPSLGSEQEAEKV